jgi:hypothetical protein
LPAAGGVFSIFTVPGLTANLNRANISTDDWEKTHAVRLVAGSRQERDIFLILTILLPQAQRTTSLACASGLQGSKGANVTKQSVLSLASGSPG